MFISQHNQWICLTTKRRAQDFPVEGFIASAQSQITQCLPSTGTLNKTWISKIYTEREMCIHMSFTYVMFWKCVEVFLSKPALSSLLLFFSFLRAAGHSACSVEKKNWRYKFQFYPSGITCPLPRYLLVNLCVNSNALTVKWLELFICFAAGLLRGAVFRKRQHSNWAGTSNNISSWIIFISLRNAAYWKSNKKKIAVVFLC